MTFYSTEEFLAAEARRGQLELRGKKPPLPPGVVRPPENERRAVQNMLDSIPEVQPGPNAFARRASENDNQRSESRSGLSRGREQRDERVAFPQKDVKEMQENKAAPLSVSVRGQLASHTKYQAEFVRRRVTPPTEPHPALRKQEGAPEQARDSACTNITDFMQAGMAESPKLKLGATPNPSSIPTFRARVEERNEQSENDKSGSDTDRVPVFHPTPKIQATREFAQRPGTPADALQKEEHASKLPVKTPKKSFISKLKLSTNSRSRDAATPGDVPADPADQAEESMPVKAQALLGETSKKHRHRASLGASPTKMLARSPSKRNYFFSRKNTDYNQIAQPPAGMYQISRPLQSPSTACFDAPQTAISDPTHFSFQQSHVWPQGQAGNAGEKEMVRGTPIMARSNSVNLNYHDNRIPPTPPAKNTPPHEKGVKQTQEVMKEPSQRRRRLPEDDEGIVTNSDRVSPTKNGNYAYRSAPMLVTQPSKYSLHASVIPDMMDATTMEEMEARVGGLDLEGVNSPTDNIIRRSNMQEALYSPSNYSMGFNTPGATPMLRGEISRFSNTDSSHTKDSSSNGTIPIVYPELASDPSWRTNKGLSPIEQNANGSPENRGRTHLSPQLTWNARTHSPDHRHGDQQSIFAQPVEDCNCNTSSDHRGQMYNSPSSFSHTSAMVSPLHYLPATVYSPPSKKGKEKAAVWNDVDVGEATPSVKKAEASARGSGLGIREGESTSTTSSEKHGQSVFDGKTSLTRVKHGLPTALQQTLQELPARIPSNSATQTQAKSALEQAPRDKLDMVLDMLNKRNSEMEEMRAELRANQARIDQRLSAFENNSRGSPSPAASPLALTHDQAEEDRWVRECRIPTEQAREFYRSAMKIVEDLPASVAEPAYVPVSMSPEEHAAAADVGAQQSEGEDCGTTGDGEGEVEGETIRELRETNKKLLEMVTGFAGKIEALEERLKRGSSG